MSTSDDTDGNTGEKAVYEAVTAGRHEVKAIVDATGDHKVMLLATDRGLVWACDQCARAVAASALGPDTYLDEQVLAWHDGGSPDSPQPRRQRGGPLVRKPSDKPAAPPTPEQALRDAALALTEARAELVAVREAEAALARRRDEASVAEQRAIDLRAAAVDGALATGRMSVPEIANHLGISRNTLYDWLDRNRSEGRKRKYQRRRDVPDG